MAHLAVVVIWVFASFIVQDIEKKAKVPFFISYVCNSMFALYFPWMWVFYDYFAGKDERKVLTHWRTAKIALAVCPVWFAAQYLYNLSLCSTTVSTNTMLSGTSSLFTFCFGVCLSLEIYSNWKIVGVLLCLAGTILVGLSDRNSDGGSVTSDICPEQNTLTGDIVCIGGAIMYAAYTLLIKYNLPKGDGSVRMTLLFAYIGLFNAILLSPILLAIGLSGAEKLSSVDGTIFSEIVLKGLF